MNHEDIEDAIDLAVAALMAAGSDAELIAAALHLKALEMDRGKLITPTRQ